MTALSDQVGGDHYRKHAIQPVEYIHANGLGVIHYARLLIELEAAK